MAMETMTLWPYLRSDDDDNDDAGTRQQTLALCIPAGGDGAVHGSRGSGWSSEPQGLRGGSEAGGCLRSGSALLGELQEVLRPVPR